MSPKHSKLERPEHVEEFDLTNYSATDEVKRSFNLLLDVLNSYGYFNNEKINDFYSFFRQRWGAEALAALQRHWMSPSSRVVDRRLDWMGRELGRLEGLMTPEFRFWCRAIHKLRFNDKEKFDQMLARNKVTSALGEGEDDKIREIQFSQRVWQVANRMAEYANIFLDIARDRGSGGEPGFEEFSNLVGQIKEKYGQKVADHVVTGLNGIWISAVAGYIARFYDDPAMKTLLSDEFQAWLSDKVNRIRVKRALGEGSAKGEIDALVESPEFVRGRQPKGRRKSLKITYSYDVESQRPQYDGNRIVMTAEAKIQMVNGHTKLVKASRYVNGTPSKIYTNLVNNFARDTHELDTIQRAYAIPYTQAHRRAAEWLFGHYPDEFNALKEKIKAKAESWAKDHANKKVYMGTWNETPKPRVYKYDIRPALEPFRYVVLHGEDYVSRSSSFDQLSTFLSTQMRPGDELLQLKIGDWGSTDLPHMTFAVLVSPEEKPKLEQELRLAARSHVAGLLDDE